MKSVGILTVHQSNNCGASLQAGALYKTIEGLGFFPEIINYRPSYFTGYMDDNNARQRATLKGILKVMIIGDRLKKTDEAFAEYAEYVYPSISKVYSSQSAIKKFCGAYDAYVCGSDQIWNPSHVHYDSTWMFDFVDRDDSNIISYAASIGKDSLNQEDLEWLKSGLQSFDDVGVREDSAVRIIEELGGKAAQCLDPTLLISQSEWRSQEKPLDISLPDKYIFYYPIEENSIESILLAELKRKTGLPCVAFTNAFKKPAHADIQVTGFGPREFLYALDKSTMTFTNSFHGLVFSLLFGKLLVSYKNEKKNSRLESMFRLLNLEDYQVSSIEELTTKNLGADKERFVSSIRFINEHKKKSLTFLQNAIQGK